MSHVLRVTQHTSPSSPRHPKLLLEDFPEADMTRIAIFLWLGVSMTLFSLLASSNALPFYPSVYSNTKNKDFLVEIEDSDAVLEMLAKLGQSILKAQHEGTNSKRGLDLGLGRGFSGSQAAKHLMGLAAANFASGPGKRKRGEELKSINFRYVSPDISDIPIQDTNAEWILTNSNRQ